MRRSTRSRLTSAGDLPRKVGGGGAATRREHEREGRVERRRADQLERLREVVVALAGKPRDEVGGHAHVGHGRAQRVHALEVGRPRV